ncbi:MAG: transaldolase [Verrucomicrobia bacterium]|nr:transaldolase [Verrucomicrobiota bacterium]MDA1065286.1 transaldolase [Verrucomicrobiota bacterium]
MSDTQTTSQNNMQRMKDLGADWWNDSCDIQELSDAVQTGAVGATSNPVIVAAAVKQDAARWIPVLKDLIRDNPSDSEEDIAWKLIARVGMDASKLLLPVFEKTNGVKGHLCLQVNPKYYRNTERMVEHGKELAALAPNIAIKAPATKAGIAAFEEMTAAGIRVNVTVSFSVAQAVAAAEAIERGLKRAENPDANHPYITIMVGRVDDQLKRSAASKHIDADPAALEWGGVAVFKHAAEIFRERGYKSTLLAAAYRNQVQWSEIIGPDVLQSIPYGWWKKYNEAEITPRLSLNEPMDKTILSELMKFDDFKQAYYEDGMTPDEFVSYGASINTITQFIEGYEGLLKVVRSLMLI